MCLPLLFSCVCCVNNSGDDFPENPESSVTDSYTSTDVIKSISVHAPDLDFANENETRGLTYTGSGVPFAWAITDTLGVYPDHGDQIGFSMASGVGTNDAVIDGGAWGLKSASTYGAYYPFSKRNYYCDRNNIILDYTGQVEVGIANADHLARYDYLASADVCSEVGRLNFNMQRLGCILILRLTVPQAGKYVSLTLSADEDVFVTQAKLSLGVTPSVTPIKKSSTYTLDLENISTTSDNQQIDLLTALSPVDLTDKTYTVSLKGANGYLYKGTKTPTSAYSAGKVTRTSITLKLDSSSNIGFGGEFNINETKL